MMKSIFTSVTLLVSVVLNAQSGKKARHNALGINPSVAELKTNVTSSVTCYTISAVTSSNVSADAALSDTSTPGCSPLAGYVWGSNCYQDKEKANFFGFGLYTAAAQPSVSSVKVTFFKANSIGTGGTPSVNVNLAIYSGSMNTGPTGAALVTLTANLGQIVAAQGANPYFVYTYTLAAPMAIPANGFFASVIVPITAGDTAVVANDPDATSNITWEKWSDDTWHDVFVAWSGAIGNLAIQPVICGQQATGISSQNYGLSKNVLLMPNPSSGRVNISVNLPSPENIKINIHNTLGQLINSTTHEAVSENNLSLDLSDQPNGVYFVTIISGNDKMVQRLILNR